MIMEYEEKYKAALERAKQFSEKPYLEDSAGIVEYIFPELKEPELAELKDERIMKALIHFFSNDENTSFEYWEGIPKAEVLAWLKKQGQVKESLIFQHENKTCKENNDSLTCEDERIKNEIIAFVEQSIHRGGGTPIPQEQENKWISWLEKQGEQNPAWSEEDEQYLLVCKNALVKYQTTDKWDANIIYNWLKNKLQKNYDN